MSCHFKLGPFFPTVSQKWKKKSWWNWTASFFCEWVVQFGTGMNISDHLKSRTGRSEKPNQSCKNHLLQNMMTFFVPFHIQRACSLAYHVCSNNRQLSVLSKQIYLLSSSMALIGLALHEPKALESVCTECSHGCGLARFPTASGNDQLSL